MRQSDVTEGRVLFADELGDAHDLDRMMAELKRNGIYMELLCNFENFYALRKPAKRGEQYRLIVDIWLKQSDDIPWTLMAINPETGRKLSLRFGTTPGDAGMMRYIVEFKLPDSGDKVHCALQFMRGEPALVRFGKVCVERFH